MLKLEVKSKILYVQITFCMCCDFIFSVAKMVKCFEFSYEPGVPSVIIWCKNWTRVDSSKLQANGGRHTKYTIEESNVWALTQMQVGQMFHEGPVGCRRLVVLIGQYPRHVTTGHGLINHQTLGAAVATKHLDEQLLHRCLLHLLQCQPNLLRLSIAVFQLMINICQFTSQTKSNYYYYSLNIAKYILGTKTQSTHLVTINLQ